MALQWAEMSSSCALHAALRGRLFSWHCVCTSVLLPDVQMSPSGSVVSRCAALQTRPNARSMNGSLYSTYAPCSAPVPKLSIFASSRLNFDPETERRPLTER
jgi:hypothetical protein